MKYCKMDVYEKFSDTSKKRIEYARICEDKFIFGHKL